MLDKHILLVTVFGTLQSQARLYVVSKSRNTMLDKRILLVTIFETLQSQAHVHVVSKPRNTHFF